MALLRQEGRAEVGAQGERNLKDSGNATGVRLSGFYVVVLAC